MNSILITMLLILLGVWLYRCYTRSDKLIWKGGKGTSLTNLVNFWYDGASGKLALRKDFFQEAIVEIIASNCEIIIRKRFPENEKFLKIPIRGKLLNGLYIARVTTDDHSIDFKFKVRDCLIKIVDKNQL